MMIKNDGDDSDRDNDNAMQFTTKNGRKKEI